ncbi:MAG: hypothetical protein AAFU79_16340 [Myxococcota bacterium]
MTRNALASSLSLLGLTGYVLALTACGDDMSLPSDPPDAGSNAMDTGGMMDLGGMTDVDPGRYCEVLLGYMRNGGLEQEVWATGGLNLCPQESWEALDPNAIQAEHEAAFITMNGPRIWLPDSGRNDGGADQPRRFYGDIEMTLAATLIIDPEMTSGEPYNESTVLRSTTYEFAAGSEIYELTAPNGAIYVMQSLAQIVDPGLTREDLPTLGSRLVLPEGWTFLARTLQETLILVAEGEATVVQDELRNTYQRRVEGTAPTGDCLTATSMDIATAGFFPEGIALADDGTAYVGSFATGEIVAFQNCSGEPQTFVPASAGLGQAVGLAIDPTGASVWVCSSNFMTAENPAIVGFSRADGSMVGRHPFPGGTGFCNDLAFDRGGNLYATDSRGGGVFRVPAGGLAGDADAEPWFDDPAFDPGTGQNPNSIGGIAVNGDIVYVSNTLTGDLYSLSIDATGAAANFTTILLDRPLGEPDGIAVVDATTLVVVEAAPNQLSRISLSPTSGTLEVISMEGFQRPTTVAVVEDVAWVVDSQFNLFMSGGQPPFQVLSRSLE